MGGLSWADSSTDLIAWYSVDNTVTMKTCLAGDEKVFDEQTDINMSEPSETMRIGEQNRTL